MTVGGPRGYLIPPGDGVCLISNKWELRKTFALRNFINVADAVFVEGRVFLNTVIFTSLSVLLAL